MPSDLGSLVSGVRTTAVDVFGNDGLGTCLVDTSLQAQTQSLMMGCEPVPSAVCDMSACKEAICQMTSNLMQADCLHSAEDDTPTATDQMVRFSPFSTVLRPFCD